MQTDLLRQSSTWRDEVHKIRNIISSLERQGFSNVNAFKVHIDYQVYKALEHQYVVGLFESDVWLYDISVDLVFSHYELQFSPSYEEIHSNYYSQLRKFIDKPNTFHGISDSSFKLYYKMIYNNQHMFSKLYEKGQMMFKQLKRFKQRFLPLLAIGYIDIEKVCYETLKNWDDWDNNFKRCKNFRQQVLKIFR